MITETERLIPMSDVPDYIASRKAFKDVKIPKPQVAAIYRWAKFGVRGVRLETCLITKRMYTSIEALNRFHSACAGHLATKPKPANRGMTKAEAKAALS